MAARFIFLVFLIHMISILSLTAGTINVSVEPETLSLEAGDTAEFICKLRIKAKYDCEDQGFLIWAKEGGILISNSTDVTPNFYNKYSVSLEIDSRTRTFTKCHYSLRLHNVTKNMAGLYGCVYYPRDENSDDFRYEIDGTANLYIKNRPAPQYPLCSATVLPNGDNGDHMRFRCESEEGYPSVSLYWWFDGYMLDGIVTRPQRNYLRLDYVISKNMYQKFKDQTLKCTMSGTDEQDSVFNECTINTSMTASIQSTHVSVNSMQESITTLICQIKASIPYDLIWYYQDKEIDSSKADDRFLIETSAQALHIHNMTTFDHGCNISCEARSIFGSVKASTILDVSAVPPPNGFGQRGSVNTGAIVGYITCGFIIILCINVALCMLTRKRTGTAPKSKNYAVTNNNTAIHPMDTDEETGDDSESMERPNSDIIMMPDLSEGIRYANVSRTLSVESTEMQQNKRFSSPPSSCHYQSPTSINESQDNSQPLALEMSTSGSGSDTSGSQECLKQRLFRAGQNTYADLNSLTNNYESPHPRTEREDSGVDFRQSYVSMDGNAEGTMEDTYEPVDLNQEKHDLEEVRPEPPSAPVPHKDKKKTGLKSSLLLPLPVKPNQDGYMEMKHKQKDKHIRKSYPEKLTDNNSTVQNSKIDIRAKSATIASPRSTHKALIQKFENGPTGIVNHKRLPERKDHNLNINKDNFKGIKEKFKGSKENLKNGTDTLRHVFKKKVTNESPVDSPKVKKLKRQKNTETDYTDLDQSSMSSEGSGAYQQICLARTGGPIEDSGVYENIDS